MYGAAWSFAPFTASEYARFSAASSRLIVAFAAPACWRPTVYAGDLVAVLPYQLLSHSFAVGGMFGEFQPERERQSVRNVRKWITDMKANVSLGLDDPSNDSATRKRKQCLRMLDAQLQLCDRIDAMIAQMERGS